MLPSPLLVEEVVEIDVQQQRGQVTSLSDARARLGQHYPLDQPHHSLAGDGPTDDVEQASLRNAVESVLQVLRYPNPEIVRDCQLLGQGQRVVHLAVWPKAEGVIVEKDIQVWL
ncbi:MAG TPA: hypothetical protein VG013_33325 [Gemmataceae bacterium]|nr:hypothetical protein [Gemmataceae bacterium]